MKVTCNTPETISITLEMTRSEARILRDMMLLNVTIPECMLRDRNGYEYTGAEADIAFMMEDFGNALSKIL